MHYNSIRPGRLWLDTNGNPIQAHGFSVFYREGIYYWYGENKEYTRPFGKVWHWGVRCYKSQDLYNWEDCGLIIPPEPHDLESPLHPAYCMDRPHILYCEKTKKYVAWLKIMGGMTSQFMSVLEADDFLGPYHFVRKMYKPLNMDAGDFSLVKDEATQKAYIIFGRPHFEVITAELTDDYTAVSGKYQANYQGLRVPFAREAPTCFERNGKHFLITSGTTGYHPNKSRVAVFDDFLSTYRDLGAIHSNDRMKTSFNSQITCVLKVPNKEDLYIACADRWMPGPFTNIRAKLFEGLMQIGASIPGSPLAVADVSPKFQTELSHKEKRYIHNTCKSRYVWLPIRWQEDRPIIEWKEEWRLEEY